MMESQQRRLVRRDGHRAIDHAYSSIFDLGSRGVLGVSADFEVDVSGPWSERCRRSLSSLEVRLSAMGSAG
jgi:hypothetical protein